MCTILIFFICALIVCSPLVSRDPMAVRDANYGLTFSVRKFHNIAIIINYTLHGIHRYIAAVEIWLIRINRYIDHNITNFL